MHLISLISLLALVLGAFRSSAAPLAVQEEIVGYGPIRQGSGWVLTSYSLYLTTNAGSSWQEITPALGADMALAADFVADGSGWLLTGRPGPDDRSVLALSRTPDFGAHWQSAALTLFPPGDPDPTIGRVELDFASSVDGRLRIRHVSSSNFERWSEWQTVDGGKTWVRTQIAAPSREDDADASGVFAVSNYGWRVERGGSCTPSGPQRICDQVTELRSTSDGGRTWHKVSLPEGLHGRRRSEVADLNAGVAAVGGESWIMRAVGHGFDKCEIAKLDQLRDWRAASPYSAVNLYIGGVKRYCKNTALTANYVAAIHDMGWTFIPTWVGPQSPCYSETSAISRDPATASAQGWAEANAAADTMRQLGLTNESGGSIVYYDMERYSTSDASCNTVVQAFAAGWKQGLHDRGHLAGFYSSGPVLQLLTSPDQAPDAIWPAHWVFDAYNSEATVWDVYRLSNDVWRYNQRLRQYAGGHPETWGNTTLTIDSNVLDGPVALMGSAPDTPTPTPTPTSTPTRVPFTPRAWVYLPLLTQE